MSFGNGAGGTLTLPSPTHPSHIDLQASVRSLRRSISRSPSKFHLGRTASQGSDASASSANSQRESPSPASPSLRRMTSQQFGSTTPHSAPTSSSLLAQNQLATPFRPNVKLSLRSCKSSSKLNLSPSTVASKSSSRNRTSPKSPPKRALSNASSSSGNSVPSSSTESDNSGQENLNIFRARSPAPRRSFEKAKSRHSMHLDMSGASLQAMTRLNDNGSNATASPLKRSDATMNLDQTSFGSPKAKRRSYGPTGFGSEFTVFDHNDPTSPTFDIHDETSREYEWIGAADPLSSPTPTQMPRRAGSLRKSTLQQRHTSERTSWGRRQAAQHLSQIQDGISTPVKSRDSRPRLSLDHYMPPPQRDSPFNMPGPLPNASVHAVNQQPPHQPHPLSRTMTTSSSNSSIPDESPTHIPVQISEKPRAPMNWSKSLPLGALRPTAEKDTHAIGSVSTPDYKSAKPFAGAFASTGLVSKMNRNPELEPVGRGGAAVPDTPCKHKVVNYATFPPVPNSSLKTRGRHMRHTFGAPSTPFNAMNGRPDAQNTFGEGNSNRPGLFNNFATRHSRKGSLLSLYSDDGRSLIDHSGDSQMTDPDVPPTPTKQQLLTQSVDNFGHLTNDSPTASRQMPAPTSAIGNGWQQDSNTICKYSPTVGSCNNGKVKEVGLLDGTSDSPTPVVRGATPPISITLPSFSRTRARRGSFSTPAPLETTKTTTAIDFPSRRVEFAKKIPVIPASPLDRLEFVESTTPRTPQENVAPPDASRLSISNPNEGFLFATNGGKKSLFPPATPTTRQDNFSLFQDRRAITPTNGLTHEVDASLLKRFGKVEYIGCGEFSEVYKVIDITKPTAPSNGFFSTPTHHTPPSPTPDKVFAVKRLRLPLRGTNDRAMRLREVGALEALRGAEHVVQLIESWEDKNNLYIQTEYCEEGSLEAFLVDVGVKGRLDDFRIWKIMLEISQGLQHIHGAGFVHLDLKPANILINFEGTLKIADFGMASSLPADKGPDFEGDREYLAPEVIRGEIDKPADIFSLGLIMLEIAANVKLPENGATWTALRENDFREVPTLTQDADAVLRDATGMPIDETERSFSVLSDESSSSKQRRMSVFRGVNRHSGDIFGLARKNELTEPPEFMADPIHPDSLDSVVKRMLSAVPFERQTISKLIEIDALHWVAARQRAGATVFEGNWGPSDEQLEPITLDTEMTDV